MRVFSVLLVAVFLASCATSPGSPIIRKNANDGYGFMINGCQNVSPNTPQLHYVTDFYLSTWASAWSEGAQVGVQEGLAIQDGDGSRDRFSKSVAAVVLARTMGYDGNLPPQTLFCMHVEAPLEKVYSIVEKILPILQNPISKKVLEEGVYRTDSYERKHVAAKWKDRYAIFVEPVDEKTTGITVYRDLWISRQDSSYVRATSNGGNEAWILQTVSKKLRGLTSKVRL